MRANRIIAISMVRNEADIIESLIRHTLKFADMILICDHMSVDRTREILESLKSEGLPIEIFSYDKMEFALRKVHNELMQRALEYGADIIVPIDADEFLIKSDGNAQDLRNFLQQLPTDGIYKTHTKPCLFLDPEKNQKQFALSRDIVMKLMPPEKIASKLILGRKFVIDNDAKIEMGNHRVKIQNGDVIDSFKYADNISANLWLVHLPSRSRNQTVSQYLCNWLSSVIFGTRYTPHGRYLSTKRDQILGSDELEMLSIDETVALNELSPYRDECTLRYTDAARINPLRNVFLEGEKYANLIVRERILSLNEQVRIFVLFDGDVERSISSIESCLEQTYEFKSIFVTLLTTKNLEQLYLAIQKFNERKFQIQFVDKSDFQNKLQSPEGSYVQFVIPGDILYSQKVMHSVEYMHSEMNLSVPISSVYIPPNFSLGKLTRSLEIPFKEKKPIELLDDDDIVKLVPGSDYLEDFINIDAILISGLSRAFFTQNLFDDSNWINAWIDMMDLDQYCLESSIMFFLMNIVSLRTITFVNETMVIRGAREWTESDLWYSNQIHDLIVQEYEKGNIV